MTATEELEMKMRQFIAERRQPWLAREDSLFALTATPLLLEEGRVDASSRQLAALLREPPTLRPGRGVRLVEPDSPVVPTLRGLRADVRDVHWLEVYRTGHIEFLVFNREEFMGAVPAHDVWIMRGWAVAEHVRNFLHLIQAVRALTGIADPYVFTLSLCGVGGVMLNERGSEQVRTSERVNPWDEGDHLLLDPMVAPADEEPDVTARRILDRLWNAFHYQRCPFFDAAGRFFIPER